MLGLVPSIVKAWRHSGCMKVGDAHREGYHSYCRLRCYCCSISYFPLVVPENPVCMQALGRLPKLQGLHIAVNCGWPFATFPRCSKRKAHRSLTRHACVKHGLFEKGASPWAGVHTACTPCTRIHDRGTQWGLPFMESQLLRGPLQASAQSAQASDLASDVACLLACHGRCGPPRMPETQQSRIQVARLAQCATQQPCVNKACNQARARAWAAAPRLVKFSVGTPPAQGPDLPVAWRMSSSSKSLLMRVWPCVGRPQHSPPYAVPCRAWSGRSSRSSAAQARRLLRMTATG